MFTATSQRSRELVNAASFSAARPSVCSTTTGALPVTSRRTFATARACSPSAVIASAPASGCPPARSPSQARVRLGEDARQAVGQLDRDRRAVAPPGVAPGQHVAERCLDDVVAAAPLEHPVVGDERDRAADAVPDGVGVGERHVGHGDPVVVADPGDRGLIGAERGSREEQPAVADGAERREEAVPPGELVAEMVGLVGDHERVRADARRPAQAGLRDARVGHGDAVEVTRRARIVRVGLQVDAQPRGRLRPLPRQRAGRADHRDAPYATRRELLARELERRPRLARAGGRGDQERARRGVTPRAHRHERARLPPPQRRNGGLTGRRRHGRGILPRAPDGARAGCETAGNGLSPDARRRPRPRSRPACAGRSAPRPAPCSSRAAPRRRPRHGRARPPPSA